MARFPRPGLWLSSLAVIAVLAFSVHEHRANRRGAERRFHDWDIPQLAAHLQGRGVDVRLRPVSENSPPLSCAYLTTTTREWPDLNALFKDPGRIAEWRGALYCERVGENEPTCLLEQWGEHGLQIGPFLFYGDAELLDRVRIALETPGQATP